MARFIGGGQLPGSDPIAVLTHAELPPPESVPGSEATISDGDAEVTNGDEAAADTETGVFQKLFSNGIAWLVAVGGAVLSGDS